MTDLEARRACQRSSPNPTATIRIGTAGWAIAKTNNELFPATGSHLQRYSQKFSAVEINSSFYRPHRRSTYARWHDEVPADFQFSVKVPKAITHEQRLENAGPRLAAFVAEVDGLGSKLGCLLVQLPPSLKFSTSVAESFFDQLRSLTAVDVVCEPRHATWFDDTAEELLRRYRVARVVADPPVDPRGGMPGRDGGVAYIRLHGSPKIYYSQYDHAAIAEWSRRLSELQRTGTRTWCIFDNTALHAAARNAADLQSRC